MTNEQILAEIHAAMRPPIVPFHVPPIMREVLRGTVSVPMGDGTAMTLPRCMTYAPGLN